MTTAHAEFEDKIAATAHQFGWRLMAVRPAMKGRGGGWATPWRFDGTGWPDLTLLHAERGALILAEVKIPPDDLTADQREWLTALASLTHEDHRPLVRVEVWRPADWPNIVAALSFGTASTTP